VIEGVLLWREDVQTAARFRSQLRSLLAPLLSQSSCFDCVMNVIMQALWPHYAGGATSQAKEQLFDEFCEMELKHQAIPSYLKEGQLTTLLSLGNDVSDATINNYYANAVTWPKCIHYAISALAYVATLGPTYVMGKFVPVVQEAWVHNVLPSQLDDISTQKELRKGRRKAQTQAKKANMAAADRAARGYDTNDVASVDMALRACRKWAAELVAHLGSGVVTAGWGNVISTLISLCPAAKMGKAARVMRAIVTSWLIQI